MTSRFELKKKSLVILNKSCAYSICEVGFGKSSVYLFLIIVGRLLYGILQR